MKRWICRRVFRVNCTIANNQTLRSGENVNQQIYLYANTLEACTIYNSVITSVNSKGDDVIRTLTYAKSIGLINSFANGYNLSSFSDLDFKTPTTSIGYNTTETTTPSIGLSNCLMNLHNHLRVLEYVTLSARPFFYRFQEVSKVR